MYYIMKWNLTPGSAAQYEVFILTSTWLPVYSEIVFLFQYIYIYFDSRYICYKNQQLNYKDHNF